MWYTVLHMGPPLARVSRRAAPPSVVLAVAQCLPGQVSRMDRVSMINPSPLLNCCRRCGGLGHRATPYLGSTIHRAFSCQLS